MLENITKTLMEMVSIPSVTGNREACHRMLKWVEGRAQAVGLHVQWFEDNGVESIIISHQPGSLSFDVLLLGHLDVVPAPECLFSPRIENGRLYGRGAADMKSGCATILQIMLDEAQNDRYQHVGLAFTTDEEVGGNNGIAYLIQQGLRAKYVFNPDGPDTNQPFTPCYEEKGMLGLVLEARGQSAHGAQPWLGANAIERLMDDLGRVRQCFDYATEKTQADISLNIGTISGGVAANSVPESARAQIDIRLPPDMCAQQVLRKLTAQLTHAVVIETDIAPAFVLSRQSKVFQNMIQALAESGIHNEGAVECGGSDVRWFSEFGTESILMLPECSAFHVDDEHVKLDSLPLFYKVVKRWVELMLGGQLAGVDKDGQEVIEHSCC